MEIKKEGGYTYKNFMKLTATEKTYKELFSTLQNKFPMYNSSMEEEDLLFSEFNNIKTKANFKKFIEFLAFVYSGLEDVIENHFFNKSLERQFIFREMGKNRYDGGQLKPDIENLINYVTKYGDLNPSSDQVEELYFQLYEELFSSVKAIEKRAYRNYLFTIGLNVKFM